MRLTAVQLVLAFWGAALFAGSVARGAPAPSARLGIDSDEAYVGIPFTATIEVTTQSDDAPPPPDFPQLDGADAAFQTTSQFSNSSFSITVNGQRVGGTENKIQYIYRITPQREGVLVIPPIKLQVNGETVATGGARLKVTKAETGDLMLVEVTAPRESIYLGEPLDATLRILIQPYNSGGIRLDERSMWSCIDRNVSSFGIFSEVLNDRSGRDIRVGKETRDGVDGNPHEYYVFELSAHIWPDRAGPLDVGDVRISCKYPLKVVQQRDFFDTRLALKQAKPIVAVIEKMPITVKPIPVEGRPAYYSGAVGVHRIQATAAPVEAHVGDPITLNLAITGSGKLETLQAPALAGLPELTQRFQIDDDQLAGRVDGNRKLFSPSLRARSTDVKEIPAIPFAYFDPVKEQFVTVATDPIAVKILPAERLSSGQIVDAGSPSQRAGAPQSLTETGEGLEANYTDLPALLAQQSIGLGPASAAAIAAGPLVYAVTALVVWRRRRNSSDTARMRRSAARKTAMQRLQHADAKASLDDAVSALRGYLADRLNLPTGGLTREDAIAALRRVGADPEVVKSIDELLAEGELAEFAGTQVPVATLSGRFREAIDRLERVRLG